MDKFNTETVKYFTFASQKPYWTNALEMVLLYPAILLFCYMSASTNHYFQNNRRLGTFIGVVGVSILGSYLHLSGPVYYIVGLIIGNLLIIDSGRLADKKFEQHVYSY